MTVRLAQTFRAEGGRFVTYDRPTLSAREAAAYLGISRPTLLRLRSQGLLAGYRATPYQNGRVRLYRDSVEEFDRQHKNQVATMSAT